MSFEPPEDAPRGTSPLPPPPSSCRYGQVTLLFDSLTEGDAKRGFVPGYRFRIQNDHLIDVGILHVRVGDTRHVQIAAGHIGYEVQKTYRGHGFAGDACLAIAPWIAHQWGSVLITVDPDNVPSIRTIERLGAVFLDEVAVPQDDPHYQRGSFRKRRYRWSPEETRLSHREQTEGNPN
ncbi:MAG: GNAT family N-acetyltransferase [Verrucomicrobiota bacterium]